MSTIVLITAEKVFAKLAALKPTPAASLHQPEVVRKADKAIGRHTKKQNKLSE